VGLAGGALVTVQTETQEQMDALLARVNAAAESGPGGGARMTLGTIETILSRVVDIESEFMVTVPQSVPTLQLLSAIDFDAEAQTWHIAYEVMGREDCSVLNQYGRTLYLTRAGNAHSGDHENACLSAEVSDAACLQQLALRYVVPSAAADSAADSAEDLLIFAKASGIWSTLTPQPHSLVQRLDLFIPHSVVKSQLARRNVRASATFGQQTCYTFGVSVHFLLAGRNTILFDSFELVENAHLQAQVARPCHTRW